MGNIITCVYCGIAYPSGTPTHGVKILTDHIKVCKKHPLRKAELTIVKLRDALIGLVGVSTRQELESMEAQMRILPAPEADKAASINAIHALLDSTD